MPSSHSLLHCPIRAFDAIRIIGASPFLPVTVEILTLRKGGPLCNMLHTTKHQKLKYLQNAKRHFNYSFLIPMAFL